MPRAKRPPKAKRPYSSIFIDPMGRSYPVQAQYQPSGDVFLFIPRDGRYWDWHRSYWVGIPEYAREKQYASGLHWVFEPYADMAVSLLQAYYPEAIILEDESWQ